MSGSASASHRNDRESPSASVLLVPPGQTLPPRVPAYSGPASAPGHLGRGPGLVDEDQAFRFQTGLALEPGLATTQNVRALLLAGVRGFF